MHGITGRRLFGTWYRLAGLFKAGLNIKPIVTHTFPMSDFAKGFDLIKTGQCGKGRPHSVSKLTCFNDT